MKLTRASSTIFKIAFASFCFRTLKLTLQSKLLDLANSSFHLEMNSYGCGKK